MKKITCIIGTRPEAIKMSPVIKELRSDGELEVSILATGQHTDMLTQALRDFGLKADVDLHIMKSCQTLDYITSSVLEGVGEYLDANKPDLILVHGDTTTTLAASLAGFYRQIPIGHVEAGLRSHDLSQPFPEEANRVLTDRLASIYFAPTTGDAENLEREGVSRERIVLTGNTVIDALYDILKGDANIPEYLSRVKNRSVILMTAHRRETWGAKLSGICEAVIDVTRAYPNVVFVIPLHKNPLVRDVIRSSLSSIPDKVIFTEPLSYGEFVTLMNESEIILSDSGGVQEEASALNKPVLIMRSVSERPEAVTHGTGLLVGTERANIRETALKLLNDPAYKSAILAKNTKPFGDGFASRKIHEAIKLYLKL